MFLAYCSKCSHLNPGQVELDVECDCLGRQRVEVVIAGAPVTSVDDVESPDPVEITSQIREDRINHPKHYTSHPSGVECITIVEHLGFCVGNAIKYLWRAGLKGDELEDLKKAHWYVDREIKRRTKSNA